MNFIKDYLAGPVHKWWVDKVWRPSWTRLWTAIYGIPSAAVLVFQQVASYAKDDTVAQYLAQMHVPNWVPMFLSTIALISYIAHGR